MKYKSCSMIENFFMNFNGRIDLDEKCVMLCCEGIDNKPRTLLLETAQESVKAFKREYAEVIAESVKLGLCGGADQERVFTAGCAKCPNFLEGDYGHSDGRIHYVNLSMYPAPCQSKCIYCNVHSGGTGNFNKELHAGYYEKVFDMLDYACEIGLVAPGARWQVSSGEIAIHPYRDRILNLVENKAATFYTNCFIFDEKIARNLASNPHSSINLSIDAGTPKTWHKIKGVDNFGAVMENLTKYFSNSSGQGQITLKYIVLPGINDNLEDYISVIEIMKILKVKHLTISRDVKEKYSLNDKEQKDNLIGAAGYLAAMLHKNGLTLDLFTYTPEERESVVAVANELLHTGQV